MSLRAALVVLALVTTGCGSPGPKPGCVPSCFARQCGDDGCDFTCGSCPSGTTCNSGVCVSPNPVPHNLAVGKAATFNADAFYGLEFLLPVQATLSFAVVPASTGTPDTFNVAIFTPTEWTSYQTGSGNQATAGAHNGVTSASDSATLPAGTWYLGFKCKNAIQRCMISFDLTATY